LLSGLATVASRTTLAGLAGLTMVATFAALAALAGRPLRAGIAVAHLRQPVKHVARCRGAQLDDGGAQLGDGSVRLRFDQRPLTRPLIALFAQHVTKRLAPRLKQYVGGGTGRRLQ
jgi:hypothetical protein